MITTQVYLIMYLLMFVAAVRLRRKQPDHPRGYRAPMLVGLCGVGFAASLAALLIGFVPPSQFGGGSAGVYVLIVARRRARPRPAGAVPLLPVPQALLEAARRRRRWRGMSTVDKTQTKRDTVDLHHRPRRHLRCSCVIGAARLQRRARRRAGRGEGRPAHRRARGRRRSDARPGPDRPGARRRRRRHVRRPGDALRPRRSLLRHAHQRRRRPGPGR